VWVPAHIDLSGGCQDDGSPVFPWRIGTLNDETKNAHILWQVLRNAASNYAGKLIALAAWFFLTPFILYQLGPTSYGLWVLVGSTAAYGALLDFGIAGVIMKDVAEYQARGRLTQAGPMLSTALCLYSVLGVIAIALSIALAPLFPALFHIPVDQRATASWLVLFMGIGIGIGIPCATTTAVLQGLHRFDLANLITTVGLLISAGATAAVLLLGGGVIGMVVVNIPITIAMQVPGIWFIKRIAPDLHFGWAGAQRSLVRNIISFSSSLLVIDMATRLQTKTDEIVIGAFLPIRSVTPYNIARKLSEMVQILAGQFLKVLFPLASALDAEGDRARLRTMYITSTRLALVILVPSTIILAVLGRQLLTAWVGAEYAGYAHLLIILAVAGMIGTSQWPATTILKGTRRHQLLAISSICSAIANLGLSIGLVRTLGLTAVALGTLIPTTIEALIFVMPYTMRVIGVGVWEMLKQCLAPALLPGVPALIILYLLREILQPMSFPALILVAGMCLLIYISVYLIFGASSYERQIYRHAAHYILRFARSCLRRV
jgi:O-antigen/teichoic acid export membrane protein